MIRTIFSFLAAGIGLFAATPSDFIPLQAGNQWVYELTSRSNRNVATAQASQSINAGGKQYFLYTSFGVDQWLRADDQGIVYLYDSASKTERVLISADGVVATGNNCKQTGHVVSRDASYKGPIGTFNGGVIEVQYDPGTCADAGLIRELYLPYVGLLQRTEQSIAGPRSYDLVYARIGGVLVATAAETSFTLAADSNTYPTDGTLRARLALRHTGSDVLTLKFSSAQEYDVKIRNDRDEIVYTWSADKLFAQVVHSIDVQGEQNWVVLIPLSQLAPGSYTAEAFLTTSTPPVYTARVAFTIVTP